MELSEVLLELEKLGSEQTRKIFRRHGAPENMFGVKVGDLKALVKRIRKNHPLALALYNTGNSDAMYLAGLIAAPRAFTMDELEKWVEMAPWYMISEYTVAWMAAESHYGVELANRWIESGKEHIAAAGWATWSYLMALKPDHELDFATIRLLLERITTGIHQAAPRVTYTMNGFVIATGSFVAPLKDEALDTAKRIGKVNVEMKGTACLVSDAGAYIRKVEQAGKLGKKKKTVVC